MKRASQDNDPLTLLIALVGISAAAVVIVVAAYLLTFRGPVSDSHELWGQFGDYLGGTLNPILGFISVIALLLTLAVQTRQLNVSKQELELRKVCTTRCEVPFEVI